MARLEFMEATKRVRVLARIGALAALALVPSACLAQTMDCGALSAQINAPSRGNPAQGARYAAAAQKQQYELNRTAAYAQSIGCSNRQFLFFGSAPPPQCPALDAQIQRMRSNLAALQVQAQDSSGEGRRLQLLERYNTYCRSGPKGFFDNLFGNEPPSDMPLDDGDMLDNPVQAEDGRPRGGPLAACVRTCDGGFFPISYTARRADLDGLDQLCKALCPNAETGVYTYSTAGDIDRAISLTGEPYTALANAGKYRKSFDKACTCKPANKSWVEALADAEATLGKVAKTDIIVTPQKAEELSRAKAVPASTTAARSRNGKIMPPPVPTEDPAIAADAAASAAAPTVGTESAGISVGGARSGPTFGLADGQTREEVGPDGKKRRVRIIDPAL